MTRKDYCFTVYTADYDELIQTWDAQEAYESAWLYEDATRDECIIEVETFCNGSLAGKETKSLFDIECDFNVTEPARLTGYTLTDNDTVIVNGIEYPYAMNLSEYVSDEYCNRVEVDGKYYYFG